MEGLEQVNIVGYSKGGLDARVFLAESGPLVLQNIQIVFQFQGPFWVYYLELHLQ